MAGEFAVIMSNVAALLWSCRENLDISDFELVQDHAR